MTTVTVMVPLNIRRRGGRKQIIGPDGTPMRSGDGAAGVATTRGDPTLVKALARAFRWRRMLEDGRHASIRELAAAEAVDRAYIGRVLNLTLLAPELVEAALDGRGPTVTTPEIFAAIAVDWQMQRATAAHARGSPSRGGD